MFCWMFAISRAGGRSGALTQTTARAGMATTLALGSLGLAAALAAALPAGSAARLVAVGAAAAAGTVAWLGFPAWTLLLQPTLRRSTADDPDRRSRPRPRLRRTDDPLSHRRHTRARPCDADAGHRQGPHWPRTPCTRAHRQQVRERRRRCRSRSRPVAPTGGLRRPRPGCRVPSASRADRAGPAALRHGQHLHQSHSGAGRSADGAARRPGRRGPHRLRVPRRDPFAPPAADAPPRRPGLRRLSPVGEQSGHRTLRARPAPLEHTRRPGAQPSAQPAHSAGGLRRVPAELSTSHRRSRPARAGDVLSGRPPATGRPIPPVDRSRLRVPAQRPATLGRVRRTGPPGRDRQRRRCPTGGTTSTDARSST